MSRFTTLFIQLVTASEFLEIFTASIFIMAPLLSFSGFPLWSNVMYRIVGYPSISPNKSFAFEYSSSSIDVSVNKSFNSSSKLFDGTISFLYTGIKSLQ